MNTPIDGHVPHPVRLVVDDGYRRSRATVFFRLFLAIPHFFVYGIFTFLVMFGAIANWVISIFTGRPPRWMHRIFSHYVRYQAHFGAYLGLVANSYPPFGGPPAAYVIDIELPDEPVTQRRWTIFFRLVLALPALLVGGGLPLTYLNVAVGKRSGTRTNFGNGGGSLLGVSAFLGWFASVALGRMPKGLRDAGAWSVGYTAQTTAYLLLLTERYPNADPTEMLATVERPPLHPVRVVGDPYDLRRSRVTVFFRLPLSIPHLVWLVLWSILAALAVIAQWFVTLFRGTPAAGLHRFLASFVRYRLHVYAYLFLVANPFPGFNGQEGMYPLDLEVAPPARQNRWKTFFRGILAVPALIFDSVLGGTLFATAILTWFYALATGSAQWGFRNLAAYALRYDAQVQGYVFLLTDSYPHASPLEGEDAMALEAWESTPLEGEVAAVEPASPLGGEGAPFG